MTPAKKHRRDRHRQIILPILVRGFLLVAGAVALLILNMMGHVSDQQITVIAGIMACLFILLPAVIVMFVIVSVSWLLAFSAGKPRGWIKKPLGLLANYTQQGAELTEQGAWRIGNPVINVRVRFARWRYVLGRILGLTSRQQEEDIDEEPG